MASKIKNNPARKKIGAIKLIKLYKFLRDSFNMVKSDAYSAVKMHPNARKTAPMHIFIEFFIDISLFLKKEKKNKNGIIDVTRKIKIKGKLGISNMTKIKIIGKRTIPA